ncbi:hypothetical protein BJP25_16005 [Actinokineospora bangkokensis]|uniref:Virginiamycin B lyase n=1 Tax=Actinokineospora bangkokensis TaxID=1193682 RepID=A0A1Q9LPH8_9PSEU|nr:hypothetical protein BJP25_16005 [Actinokineospora bangkokensis]
MRVRRLPLGSPGDGPYDVVAAGDGTAWVSLVHAGAVVRVDLADGRVMDRVELGADSKPTVLAVAAGAVWCSRGDGWLSEVTGRAEAVRVDGTPYGVAATADGALWFSEMTGHRLGRVADGAVDYVPLPAGSFPAGVVQGPDGAVWCALNTAGALARVDADLGVTVHPLPTPGAAPVGVTATADAVWCVQIGAGQLARVSSDGQVREFPLPDRAARPHAVVPGSGGVWFTEWAAAAVGFCAEDGTVVRARLPKGSEPHGLTAVGPGVWVACESGELARVDPA